MPTISKEGRAGVAVDSGGGPVVDPTVNVKDNLEASNRRQDDLRDAERRCNDLREQHQKEINSLRDGHAKELAEKESKHLALVRQVDREDTAKTAAAADVAILALAKQTTDLATTLSAQQQAAAAQAETRRSADNAETNKRLSQLELAGSASAGKQTVADPALALLLSEVKELRAARNVQTGFDAGKAAMIAGAGVIGGGGIGALIMNLMKQ